MTRSNAGRLKQNAYSLALNANAARRSIDKLTENGFGGVPDAFDFVE
jgi:hypothetical protein